MFGGRTGAFGASGDTGELRDDADSARRRLEIHGVPAPGADSWGNNRDEWPSLPGAPGFPARSSHWGGDPCPWAASLAKSRFSLGDSLWPSLASRQEQQRDDDEDAKHGHNPGLSGGLERNGAASIQCGDILATKGPTQQRSHQLVDQGRNGGANGDGDGFVVRGIDPGGGKGWMRLPPISMPSSSSPSSNRQHQQQQKRCRQAAFFDGAPANSNSNSNPPSPEKGSNASSRGIGVVVDGVGSSSPPPPPPLPPTRGYLPPVYLMLNKDFVVISPLKENLLLTLALTQHRRVAPSSPRSFGYDEDDVVVDDDGGAANFAAAARLFQHESSPMDDDEEEVAQVAAVAAAAAAAATATATGIAATATAAVASSRDAKRRQVFVGRFEAFSSFVKFGLGRDAMRVATESNAGGTSTISESLSVEYFVRKFKATDVVTEMEVEYCAMNWKKVDYICNLYGQRVGVSVTRAMSYPNPDDFSPQMAYRLLYKKLFGLVVARHGVTDRHSFSQCILHVWCETTSTAKLLQAQYKEVSEELDITDDVIMVLTVAEGWHARPIFYESCLVRDLITRCVVYCCISFEALKSEKVCCRDCDSAEKYISTAGIASGICEIPPPRIASLSPWHLRIQALKLASPLRTTEL